MVADALLHLLPEALEENDASRIGFITFLGAVSVLVFETCLEFLGFAKVIAPYGIANLAVESLHNFIDGIALGAAFAAGGGISATIAIAAHELPQELGDFAILKSAGFSTTSLLLLNAAVSLTSFLGVALAHRFQDESALLAFTAGTFLALALHSIALQARDTLSRIFFNSSSSPRTDTDSTHSEQKKDYNKDLPSRFSIFLLVLWSLFLILGSGYFLVYLADLEHASEHHRHHHHDHHQQHYLHDDDGHDHHHEHHSHDDL
eukprot:CAMPEP_0197299102 /NCGR_PEP_ID=MMETSP0890-20130614/45249_1 /TAXON_ID=44058 ORGANISM="Aureoumbra lagunensis, Strain CCMP1510" /NCGR_SAMPLE_ID=MMETSP0890 /ASSEMBLY_ACC=CAM_ASM_000533 /LENGTH=261 /DNA_ID=CAMNT_0042777253 /DNA_START=248 /DNA_END=1033 /DNA_ORIENTATION=-